LLSAGLGPGPGGDGHSGQVDRNVNPIKRGCVYFP